MRLPVSSSPVRQVRPAPALLVLPALLLSACSGEVSVGGGSSAITQDALEAEVEGNMSGADVDQFDVACEGRLDAEVDATQDCLISFAGDGSTTGVRLVVTDVQGEEVEFDQVLFIPAEDVADGVERFYVDQGFTVDAVTCAGELVGEEGETTTCQVESSADGDAEVEATTTTVDGLVVNFDLTVVS